MLISQALQTIDEDEYTKCLRELVEVKLRTLASVDDERVIKQKIFSYLASKGFEENLIFQELNKRKKIMITQDNIKDLGKRIDALRRYL